MVGSLVNGNNIIPQCEFLDPLTKKPSRPWLFWLQNPSIVALNLANPLNISSGGTGTSQLPANGELLIGNNGSYSVNNIDNGNGIGITNGAGTILIENTGVLSNIAGNGISVDQATGNVTIENTGVLSIIAGRGIEVDQATGNVTISTVYGTFATKTANFVLADDESYVINNKSGSACTVTLPAAADWAGRPVFFQNYQPQQLLSASSNIVPQGGGAATNVILSATDGAWAMIVSNGTNWAVMESSGGSGADQESQTATSGQTVFNLTTMSYVPGSNTLSVFVDGVNQILTDAYIETNSTTVTFTAGLHVGAKVRFATA